MRTRVSGEIAHRAHHLTRAPFALAQVAFSSPPAAKAVARWPNFTDFTWDTTAVVGAAIVGYIGLLYKIGKDQTSAFQAVVKEQHQFAKEQTAALDALANQQHQFAKEQTAALNAQGEKQTAALNSIAKELTSALNAQHKELTAAMGMLRAEASDHRARTTVLETKFVAAAPARQLHNLRRFSAFARTFASLARRVM